MEIRVMERDAGDQAAEIGAESVGGGPELFIEFAEETMGIEGGHFTWPR